MRIVFTQSCQTVANALRASSDASGANASRNRSLSPGGCATTQTTGALATPWGLAGIHSFKPEQMPVQPNAAKVDKQVAQLLDNASQVDKDADVRVAALQWTGSHYEPYRTWALDRRAG